MCENGKRRKWSASDKLRIVLAEMQPDRPDVTNSTHIVPRALLQLETGGVYSRLIGGAVLERLFSSKKPLPGETVRLTFEGQETSRSGRFAGKSYNNWSLEVQRPPRILDWRKLAMGEVELVEFEPTAKQLEAPKPVEASVPEADVVINTAGLPAPAEEDEDVPF